MKKAPIFSLMIAAILTWSCGGGSTQGETPDGDTLTTADSTATVEADEIEEPTEEEEVPEAEATLNKALFGKFSNYNDPNIQLELSETVKTFEAGRGYGYIQAANDYFEYDFKLVFKSITPEGDNIRVHYDKMEVYFDGGDPDDLGGDAGEGEWVETKVGEGDLTLVPAGNGKVKIESKEARIKNKVLRK